MASSDWARRCAEEMVRYHHGRPYDPTPCYELFRLALVHQDQTAWTALFRQYSRLVRHWVRGAPGDPDALVNEAFERFWKALSPSRFQHFSSLDEILAYLKRCAQSVAIDARRREERERIRASALAQMRAASAEDQWDPLVERILDEIVRKELYERAMASLMDPLERLIFRASFEWDMKPRQIAERWKQMFADAQEVSRIKERILRRLRRDKVLRDLMDVENGDNPA